LVSVCSVLRDVQPYRRIMLSRAPRVTPLEAGQWIETWLSTIAPRRIRRSTLETTYAPRVRNRIIPGFGKHRLDRLTPEHIERFYTRLEAEGPAPATVLQVHRILSRALKVAMQRGYVVGNVATLVDAPSASPRRNRAADP
jgi:integrase